MLSVTTFNNALGMKQRREVLEGTTTNQLELGNDVINSDYVFVTLNTNRALVQNQDYSLTGRVITIGSHITLTTSDRIDIMYFAVDSATNATGFRIFKDMLNRTFYKRISKTSTTKLSANMTEGTQTITVQDGTVLGTPNISASAGVISNHAANPANPAPVSCISLIA